MERILNTSHLHVPENWLAIWKIKAPLKIKHFLWRVLRGCLPSRTNLCSKGIQCPSNCDFCSTHFKFDWHSIIECEMTREFCETAHLWHLI